MTFYPIYVETVTFNINSYPRVKISFFCDFGELKAKFYSVVGVTDN